MTDAVPDDTFHQPISNKAKADYIITCLRIEPYAFNLDLPLPLEDWSLSDDLSLIKTGLYLADMRRQFYAALMKEHRELLTTEAFCNHAEAEWWQNEFNRLIAKRQGGVLFPEFRVLN